MLFNLSSGVVKQTTFEDAGVGTSPTQKNEQDSQSKFDFEMLKQVERLAGFYYSKTGLPLVKMPIWKVLTEKDYEKLVGNEILCRMIPYENEAIGLKKNTGIETHSYDNYFILIPKQNRVDVPKISVGRTRDEPKIKENVLEKIRITIQDNFPEISLKERIGNRKKDSSVFANISSNITAVDLNRSIEVTSRLDKRDIKLKNKNIKVSTGLILDAIALDCLSTSIPSDFMNNNTIGLKNFDNILRDPRIAEAFLEKQKLAIRCVDEIEDDRCSVFKIDNKICKDK